MNLKSVVDKIEPLKALEMEYACKRWNSIAKPLHSLGKMEDIIIQIAGITGDVQVNIEKKALIAMCADNGVVEEGVTQTGQEVTAIVAENFLDSKTSACVMCNTVGCDMIPIDIGMIKDTRVRNDKKIAYGTKNMTKGSAMTYEEALRAIEAGIEIVQELKEQGYQILATGEMGIGNTTSSSAVASILLEQPVEVMTGRGAGLSSEGMKRKIDAIKRAIACNQPDINDPVDVLAKVGGFDIAGLVGVFLGGAVERIPVVMDGFISCVAALAAARICPLSADYMIASHVSKEPAANLILKELKKEAVLHADMCLGEGTGAVTLFPFIDLGRNVYLSMSTFDDISVEQYEELV